MCGWVRAQWRSEAGWKAAIIVERELALRQLTLLYVYMSLSTDRVNNVRLVK